MAEGYEQHLMPEHAALLKLTDDIIGHPGQLSPATIDVLREHFSDAELVEVALGVGLFLVGTLTGGVLVPLLTGYKGLVSSPRGGQGADVLGPPLRRRIFLVLFAGSH